MPETIFMIHGMWGGGWVWDNYRRFFESEGYECVTPTLRHHDMEPQNEPNPRLGTTSLLDYADDLEQDIEQLDEPPILMGHSMGGLLAQILATRRDPKAAILLTPASPAGILPLTPSVIKSFWSVVTTWAFWRKPVRQTFDEAVYSMLHLLPPERQRAIYDRFVYESGRAVGEIGFWFLDPNHAARVDASRVTCPLLVIAGSEDRITPVSVVRRVAQAYDPVSTYREFPGQAHWVLGEPGWETIAAYVHDWLEQRPTETAS